MSQNSKLVELTSSSDPYKKAKGESCWKVKLLIPKPVFLCLSWYTDLAKHHAKSSEGVGKVNVNVLWETVHFLQLMWLWLKSLISQLLMGPTVTRPVQDP